MNEIWKDIKGYEGLYQVSNLGNVKSLERYEKCGNFFRIRKEKILKSGKSSYEHLIVVLCKNGIRKPKQVHRLVAEHFILNLENKSDVHHIDHNPKNNRVDNLMWVTDKEHSVLHSDRITKMNKASADLLSKLINQYDLNGNFIRKWKSTREIERELGYNHTNIIKCCKGKYGYKSSYGYVWKYA